LQRTDFLTAVLLSGASAIEEYLEMTGDGQVWDTPEFWLKAQIARHLRKECGFYIYLERRVSDLVSDANSGELEKRALEGVRQTGRIDLVVYEGTQDPSQASIIGVVEVKKVTSSWCFNDDILRILDVLRLVPDAHGIVAGLFQCKHSQQAQDLRPALATSLNGVPGLARDTDLQLATTKDDRSYTGMIGAIVRSPG
jgi:hypothetical protein